MVGELGGRRAIRARRTTAGRASAARPNASRGRSPCRIRPASIRSVGPHSATNAASGNSGRIFENMYCQVRIVYGLPVHAAMMPRPIRRRMFTRRSSGGIRTLACGAYREIRNRKIQAMQVRNGSAKLEGMTTTDVAKRVRPEKCGPDGADDTAWKKEEQWAITRL